MRLIKLIGITFLYFSMISCKSMQTDTRPQFLKEQPFKKVKQRIDVSCIKSKKSLEILEEAIYPILQIVLISSSPNPSIETINNATTDNGAKNLKYPYLDSYGNRYIYEKIVIKKVEDDQIDVDMYFIDLLGKQKLQKFEQIYIKKNGKWGFDRYAEN